MKTPIKIRTPPGPAVIIVTVPCPQFMLSQRDSSFFSLN
jgi:hypothetical protein